MNFTGERVIPGEVDSDLFNEHWARYLFARQFCAGKKVLDVACGSGYGSALMAEAAAQVCGADIAAEAIAYARLHYGSPKTVFLQADCRSLPIAPGGFDVVVAFEIIEHLDAAESFLKELRRVLAPAGLLILSTPNRLYYTEDRGEVNPFHHQEFSFPELAEMLRGEFPHCAILLENHVAGLLVADSRQAGNLAENAPACRQPADSDACSTASRREREAYYMLAVCSSRPLPAIQPLLYLPSTGNVLRERETHIRRLEEQLTEAREERDSALAQIRVLESQLEERTRWAKQLDQSLAEKDAYVVQLQSDYDQKVQWALDLQRELDRACAALEKLQQEFEERTAWALQMDAELRLVYGSRWYRIGKNLRLNPVPASDQRPKKG